MAPVALHPQDNSLNRNANGKNASAVAAAVTPEARDNTAQQVHLSSADVIRLEHEYGAHNYHPLPVVFDRALGAIVWDPEGKDYIDMLSAYS